MQQQLIGDESIENKHKVPRIDAVEQPKALYTDNSCSKPV
jgi:hypothetical protein